MLFASAGYNVTIYDIKREQTAAALADIQDQLRNLSQEGLLRGNLSEAEQFAKIKTTENLEECVQGAFFIQVISPCFYFCTFEMTLTLSFRLI